MTKLTRRDLAAATFFAAGHIVLPAMRSRLEGLLPRRGGTLNLLVEPEPPTLATIAHTAGSSLKVSAKVLEGLLAYDEELNAQPQLATAWSVSTDGLEYRFTLRHGVKWHDGTDSPRPTWRPRSC
jgi:peptide/nickel transport system substrate-binding protein